MSEHSIEELEASIQRYYERYSAKRVALTTFLVGVVTIGLTYVAYALTMMALLAIIVFGVVGLLSVYLTMFFVVPTSKSLAESCELLCSAIREPSRIKSVDKTRIQLEGKEGDVHSLTGPALEVWTMKVVPYFMQNQSSAASAVQAKPERKYTVSERKYIEDRRKEVLEIEKRVEEERKVIDKERKDIEKRSAELRQLEAALRKKRAEVEGESEPERKPAHASRPRAGQS